MREKGSKKGTVIGQLPRIGLLAHYDIRIHSDQFFFNKSVPMVGNRAVKKIRAVCNVKMSNFEGSVQTCYVININCRPPIYDAEMTSGAVKRTHPVTQGTHDVIYAFPRMYQDRL